MDGFIRKKSFRGICFAVSTKYNAFVFINCTGVQLLQISGTIFANSHYIAMYYHTINQKLEFFLLFSFPFINRAWNAYGFLSQIFLLFSCIFALINHFISAPRSIWYQCKNSISIYDHKNVSLSTIVDRIFI